MKIKDLFLRALEPSDIKILMQLENDESYWKYSNTTEPFSKKLLTSFIAEQKRDIFEVKQKRYVISNQNIPTLGFIDLFNFEPLHRRAGVGILIIEKFRGKGLGKKALDLLISHSKKNLNINCLFANIAFENKASISLFKSSVFIKVGLKKSWNFYYIITITPILLLFNCYSLYIINNKQYGGSLYYNVLIFVNLGYFFSLIV